MPVARAFRPIHYLGSKLRLLERIGDLVAELNPRGLPVCDLFAGSGTVAYSLAARYPVVAVDIQEYSRVLCSALLQSPRPSAAEAGIFLDAVRTSPLRGRLNAGVAIVDDFERRSIRAASDGDLAPLCDLIEHGSVLAQERGVSGAATPALRKAMQAAARAFAAEGFSDSPAATITRYYGGVYFSYRQAAELDIALDAAHRLGNRTRDFFLAAILSTTSDIVNTVGKQFAQPIAPRKADGSPKLHLLRQVERDRFRDVQAILGDWLSRYVALPEEKHDQRVIRADYREALDAGIGKAGVIYADPPYTRDHYSRYYHVLETMCLRDSPDVSTTRIGGITQMSRGIYRAERHQSPFCIKSQAPRAFTELFERTRRAGVPLIVSYSPYAAESRARPRLLTMEQLEELATRHYRRVERRSGGKISHNKLNNAGVNVERCDEAESFFVCLP